MSTGEREITTPVSLTREDGHLNPDAVGFTRTHLHDTSAIGTTPTAWGRNKRWEYWLITTPTHLLSLTISDVDYASSHSVWAYEIPTGKRFDGAAIVPFGIGAVLPPSLGDGPAIGGSTGLTGRLLPPGPGRISARIDEVSGGTRLRAHATARLSPRPGRGWRKVRADVVAERPEGHEALGVVVPWSETRFQYTVKDVARPARGWIELDGERYELPEGESWATLDHGRGRWPYRMWWNWGAGVGRIADGRAVGLQFGGKWTDGTGSRENAVQVDGRLFPVHEDLVWEYNDSDWLAPWRIHSPSVDVTLEPFWDHDAITDLGVIAMKAHQVFGHYSGWVDVGGERIEIDRMLGFAEDVRNKW
ncbi:MAG: DUF2804 domain-containing protein [bacterium]|nr:DUF2804 domain-containing protein [bacterium]